MISKIFEIVDNLISCQEPWKSLIVCMIYTIILLTFVIIIGFIVNQIETYQMKLLNKFVGQKVSSFICNRLTFPGVMIHELSHALFATIMGAKVTKIKLLTLQNDGRLGWIEYIPRGNKWRQGLQHTFCSCAPTVVGLILELFIIDMFSHGLIRGFGWITFTIYMMISIGDHMSMSKQDIKNYMRGIWAPFIVCYGILLVLRLG